MIQAEATASASKGRIIKRKEGSQSVLSHAASVSQQQNGEKDRSVHSGGSSFPTSTSHHPLDQGPRGQSLEGSCRVLLPMGASWGR